MNSCFPLRISRSHFRTSMPGERSIGMIDDREHVEIGGKVSTLERT